jgi:hypothetical protein
MAALLLVPAAEVVANYKTNNYRDEYFFEDVTKAVMTPLEDNAIVMTKLWDYWLASSLYYQHAEGLKPNVLIVDKELVRRTWYLNYLEERDPWLFAKSKAHLEAFKVFLGPFERDETFDANGLQREYLALNTAILGDHIAERPVYLSPELVDDLNNGEVGLPKGYTLIPYGLLLRLVPDNQGYVPYTGPPIVIRPSMRSGKLLTVYHKNIRSIFGRQLALRAAYERQFGHEAAARNWDELAFRLDPEVEPIR